MVPTTNYKIIAIAHDLTSRSYEVRESASRSAQALSEASKHQLLACLMAGFKRTRKLISLVSAIGIVACVIGMILYDHVGGIIEWSSYAAGMLVAIIVACILYGSARRHADAIVLASTALFDSGNAVGPLVEALLYGSRTTQKTCSTIEDAASKMVGGAAHVVDADQSRLIIARIMGQWDIRWSNTTNESRDLRLRESIAMLRLLARSGMNADLLSLEFLTRRRANNEVQVHLQHAIVGALAEWKSRIGDLEYPSSLLRAASRSDGDSEMLRPSQAPRNLEDDVK